MSRLILKQVDRVSISVSKVMKRSVSDRDQDHEEEQAHPAKRQKKWFQDASSDEEESKKPATKRSKRAHKKDVAAGEPVEVNTLEDLEALASGLLG